MFALRVILGAASLLGLAVFALILLVGKGFDAFRSGSGGDDALETAATIAVPLMLCGMAASVFLPGNRWLLHAVAALALPAAVYVCTIVPEHPGEGGMYLTFLLAWLLYYWLAAWARP